MKQIKLNDKTFNKVETLSHNENKEGWKVWNITPMGNGIIPLYLESENYQVNIEKLAYIQGTEFEAKVLHDCAGWGIRTLKQCKSAINTKRKGPTTERKRILAQRALATFEKFA